MSWFKRREKGIQTKTEEKKDTPKGLWYKTPTGKIIGTQELTENNYVSPEDDYHVHIGSKEYFEIIFDDNKYEEIDPKLKSRDFLKFIDSKKYINRLKEAHKKTGLYDAIRVAIGLSKGNKIVVACMDFRFIGGSMGSVVGEKFVRAVNLSIERNAPLVSFSSSGGARMQEAFLSLMQLAKTTSALVELDAKRIPYISVLTDPTTGGVSASIAMLGDINLAEPGALIGFAGPRVIEQTVGETLPEGFQRSDFLLEKGAIDMIVDRRQMRDTISTLISNLMNH